MYIRMHTNAHTHNKRTHIVTTSAHMRLDDDARPLAYTCVCVCVCVYIYIYTHTHTHDECSCIDMSTGRTTRSWSVRLVLWRRIRCALCWKSTRSPCSRDSRSSTSPTTNSNQCQYHRCMLIYLYIFSWWCWWRFQLINGKCICKSH